MAIIEGYMRQACTLTPQGAPSRSGLPTPGVPVATPCRYWRQTQRVRLPDGEVVETQGVLQVPATVAVAPGTTVAIDGEAVTHRVRLVVDVPDIDGGIDHRRCYLDGAGGDR